MKLKFKKKYIVGVAVSICILILDLVYFWKTRWFISLLIIALSIAWVQFWLDFFKEQKRHGRLEEEFLEFLRAIVSSVKTGSSIPQALILTSKKDYGLLSKYTSKLANQLESDIPVQDALLTFSKDVNNKTITKAISIILESERSGGGMKDVLESVTESIVQVKKMKEERRAATFPQIIQGYIVFYIFIGIMLLLQLKLFPTLQGMAGSLSAGLSSSGLAGLGNLIGKGEHANLDRIFFSLVIIQGLFAGIMIGKFSEGTLKQGIMHSLVLITSATLVVTLVKGGI